MDIFLGLTPKREDIVESVQRCRLCLAPQSAAKLTRRDLATFYCAFRPRELKMNICAAKLFNVLPDEIFPPKYDMEPLKRRMSEPPNYTWVCQYCWVRASQCIKFIDCARNAQHLLTIQSSDTLSKRLYPYTISPVESTSVCSSQKCQQRKHEINIEPEFLICDQVRESTPPQDVKIEKQENFDDNYDACLEPEVAIADVKPLKTDERGAEKSDSDEETLSKLKSGSEASLKSKRHSRRRRQPRRSAAANAKSAERTSRDEPSRTDDLCAKYGVEYTPYTLQHQREEVEAKKQSEPYLRRKHKCVKCGSAFNEEESYDAHISKWHHESAGEHECRVCYYRFGDATTLRRHSYSHGRRWRCLSCGCVLTRVQLEAHHSRCSKTQPAECNICGNVLQSTWHLKVHIRNQHKTNAKNFVCDTCGKAFRFKSHIRDHIRCHTGFKPYVCELCSKSSTSAVLHQAHMRTHSQKEQREDSYCVECNVYFKTKYLLHNHLTQSLNHVSKMAYKNECPHCKDRFLQPSQLRRHIDTVHLNLRHFQCTQCGKAYFTKGVLKTHIRSKHTPRTRDHICNICGKAFLTKKYLNQHNLAIHMKERPYKCETCNATFGYPGALFTHNKLRHKVPKKGVKQPGANNGSSEPVKPEDSW